MKTSPVVQIIIFLLFTGTVMYLFSAGSSPKIQSVTAVAIPTPSPNSELVESTPTPVNLPKTNTKVQVIKATYGPPFGFIPTQFTVKAGNPVRLEVYATEDGRGCMGSIMIPQLVPNNIQFFSKGETNIFEFTPQTPSEYAITCAMGIPHATITVE